MALYSERFFYLSQPLVLETYTVPSGKRAVVRCITMVNTHTSASRIEVVVGGLSVFAGPIPARDSRVEGQLRAVAYAGETMAGYLYNEGNVLSVHGYLFDDTEQGEMMAQAIAAPGKPILPMLDPDEYT